MKRIAIIVFVPNNPLLIQQFFGLYYSVMIHPNLRDYIDFIIGCEPGMEGRFELGNCIVSHATVLSEDPSYQFRLMCNKPYGYINSWSHFTDENSNSIINDYDFALRIDVDTFISPNILNVEPGKNEIITGIGGYFGGGITKSQILRVSKELKLKHRGIHNIGSTWYSTSTNMIKAGKLALKCAKHLLQNEFSEEGTWPEWYSGVITLYAGEIALNHLDIKIKKSDKFDAKSTKGITVNDIYAIHCWPTDAYFSKHHYISGKYNEMKTPLNLESTADYAFFLTRLSEAALNQYPNYLSAKTFSSFQTVRLSTSNHKQAILGFPKEISKKVTAPFLCFWNGPIRRSLKLSHTPDPADGQIQTTKFLCLCARPTGHPEMYAKLAEQAAAITNWEHLPYLAEQHGLAPLVYYHLREAKIEIPIEVNRTLKGAYLTHRHANRERMAALKEIATAYREIGVKMLALKGAALANTVYPDIALRCMCDLDLMVANKKASISRDLLEELGFNIHKTATIQPKAFSHHFPPALRDRNGVNVMVELHHHLYSRSKLFPSVTLDKLLPEAISFELNQTSIDTLGPEQMLWHSYIHAVGKLQLVERFRLIHVADLIGLVEAYADLIDWHRLEKHYKQTYHAIMMLHLFSPWSQAVKQHLPFDTEATFNFRDFPELPSAMSISSRDRKAWVPRFFKDTLLPPDWWVCFFQGNHPVKFNTLHYRVVYPLRRISAFWGNLAGFYIRKWYRKWSRATQLRK